MRAGLFRIFVDMGCELTAAQGVAKLGTQETVGRIPSGARIEPVCKIPDHCRVLVNDVGIDAEIVVVDDHMDFSPGGRKHRFDNAPYSFDILWAANDVPFEVDEKLILFRMICKALFER